MKKTICKNCNKEFVYYYLEKHQEKCVSNFYNCEKCGIKVNKNNSYGSGRFCSIQCANSREHSEETKNKIKNSIKNSELFNAFCISLQKEKFLHNCPICKKEFFLTEKEKQTFCSKKCRLKDVNFLFQKKPTGGYRKGSGRSISGWYKGIWCDSTYELVYVIYNLEHNIDIKRNTETFDYIFENENCKYLPDFKINDTYIEIKGFKNKKWEAKLNQFPKDKKLLVLYRDDLKNVFDYIYDKYKLKEKNFKNLYNI